jgi:hypothetical protein
MLELDLLHFEEELSLAQQHAAMEKFRFVCVSFGFVCMMPFFFNSN